jgi:predicted component of type VI protein secretion system
MTWEDQQWRVTNLSRTNPMAVNGTQLAPDNGSVTLQDGDRIEMGEVVFRYRSK